MSGAAESLLAVETSGPEATTRLAAAVARLCRSGDCLALMGDLGAGKTAFARGFIHALVPEAGEVPSPTFTLVQSYASGEPGAEMTVWHYDLYRLKQPQELDELGLDEALERGVTLIEWPEMALARLPAGRLNVNIEHGDAPGRRLFSLRGGGDWPARLMELSACR